jgi:hypothetical protein
MTQTVTLNSCDCESAEETLIWSRQIEQRQKAAPRPAVQFKVPTLVPELSSPRVPSFNSRLEKSKLRKISPLTVGCFGAASEQW